MAPSAPQICYWSDWISTNRFHQIFLVVDLMAVGFVEFLVLTEIPMMIKISPSNTYSSDNFKISDDSCGLLFNKHFYLTTEITEPRLALRQIISITYSTYMS